MAIAKPTRDARLIAYSIAGLASLFLAIAASRGEYAAVAAPFLVRLVIGLRFRAPVSIEIATGDDKVHLIEGDVYEVVLALTTPPGMAGSVTLRPTVEFDLADATMLTSSFNESGSSTHRFRLIARTWGDYHTGTYSLTLSLPGSLLTWENFGVLHRQVRVLPKPVRLRELLDPAAAHTSAGVHRSKLIGEGDDFAEIREYQPGDRLRDLNWMASARRSQPHVNRQHPDRAGEVVFMIDTFTDVAGSISAVGKEALARCARATWSLARLHLAAQDRVGFLAYGRVGMWLPGGGGDRARYRLLETLLEVGTRTSSVNGSWIAAPTKAIPPAALVVAFTPLWDTRIIEPLRELRRAGRNVTAIVVDVVDLIPPPANTNDEIAYRIWQLNRRARLDILRATGVHTVDWPAQSDLGHVISHAVLSSQMAGSR